VAGLRSLRKRAKAVGTYFAERREADRFQPEGWETAEGRALLSQYRDEINGKAPAADLTGETTAPVPPGPIPAGPLPARPMPAGPVPTGRGIARVPHGMSNDVPRHSCTEVERRQQAAGGRHSAPDVAGYSTEVTRHSSREVARHSADAVAADINHRPRHDGTQSQVDPSYLLTRTPVTRHGTPGPTEPTGPTGTTDPIETTGPTETARVLTITNIVRGPDGDPLAGAIVTISLIADYSLPGFQSNATIDGVARIVTAEEGTWSVNEAAGSEVVPVNTHYQIAEVTGRWPDGRLLVRAPADPDAPAA
jgi:hypothetical protein